MGENNCNFAGRPKPVSVSQYPRWRKRRAAAIEGTTIKIMGKEKGTTAYRGVAASQRISLLFDLESRVQ